AVALLGRLPGEALAALSRDPPPVLEDARRDRVDRLAEIGGTIALAPAAALEPAQQAQHQPGVAGRADRPGSLAIGGAALPLQRGHQLVENGVVRERLLSRSDQRGLEDVEIAGGAQSI